MPRLEGGTNNTSKIGLIVLAVLIGLGVAWYALSGSKNAEVDNGATQVPTASDSSPQVGSPPAPPDGNTAVMPDDAGNTAGAEIGGDVTPAPGAMDGNAMTGATAMGGADAMATSGASSDGAGVTMTPAGTPKAMSSNADSYERSKTIKTDDKTVTYTKKFKDTETAPVKR